MPAPAPIRNASTVMLVRDAQDDAGRPAIEVCMLRRNLDAEFVAGAYVFPGGSVDPADEGDGVEAVCHGRSDAEASAVLGVDRGGLSYWVAALRECFEEAGVLLAYSAAHLGRVGTGGFPALLDTSDAVVSARFLAYRDGVNAGTVRLVDICRHEGLVLAVDNVHYFSHWITPSVAPKRFDTRFFVTVAPAGQVAVHDDGETIATIWIRPSDALARQRAGELQLMPPTMDNLSRIGQFTTTSELLAAAAAIEEVPAIEPIVIMEDDSFQVLRPGDAGYEQARAARHAADGDG